MNQNLKRLIALLERIGHQLYAVNVVQVYRLARVTIAVRRRKLCRTCALAALALGLVGLSSVLPGARVGAGSPGRVSVVSREESSGLTACYTGCGGQDGPAVNAALEQQVIDLVNAERAARGLPPLKLSDALRSAARYHAADMAQDDYFDHDTYDRVGGRLQQVCEIWTRVESYYPSPRSENIAAGYTTPASVMAAWMQSGGHRTAILNADYREIGVGYAEGGSWSTYWVQDFGTREDVYPLVIDAEAASTSSARVSLYLYGEWNEVRLRNDGEAWTSWQPFAHQIDWTLPSRAGQRTVYAEMRSGGQTAASSDTISLTAAPALGGLPAEMRFLYSRSEQSVLPLAIQGTPLNVGSGDRFTWRATVTGDRFQGEALSGRDGDSFRILPVGYAQSAVGVYRGTATVTVEGQEGVLDSPQQIALTLQVVEGSFVSVYLPMVANE